jgi:hypothetical protein|tara:strand:+ start:76 stop:330 length:255 start_codon:yes stop_codon:yes gene_type:complete
MRRGDMIRYFCDDCGKEVVIDQHPLDMECEVAEGVDLLYHETGLEVHSYDRRTDEVSYQHQCKDCHVKTHKEESFYFDLQGSMA